MALNSSLSSSSNPLYIVDEGGKNDMEANMVESGDPQTDAFQFSSAHGILYPLLNSSRDVIAEPLAAKFVSRMTMGKQRGLTTHLSKILSVLLSCMWAFELHVLAVWVVVWGRPVVG